MKKFIKKKWAFTEDIHFSMMGGSFFFSLSRHWNEKCLINWAFFVGIFKFCVDLNFGHFLEKKINKKKKEIKF